MQPKILPVYLFDNTETPNLRDFLITFKDATHFVFVVLKETYGHFLISTDKLMEEVGLTPEQRKNSLYISYNQEELDVKDIAHMLFYSYISKKKDLKYLYTTMAIVSKDTLGATMQKAIDKHDHLKENFYLCVDEGEPETTFNYSSKRCYLVNIVMMILKYHENIERNYHALESLNCNPELQPIPTLT